PRGKTARRKDHRMPTGSIDRMADRAARITPPVFAHGVRGLSDRLVGWLFIAPTIFLLLAVTIFPLIWTVYLSFTNYRANQPGRAIRWVGTENYERVLTSSDIWGYL